MNPNVRRAAMTLVALALLVACAFAGPTTKPAPMPIVTVKLTDGTSVRGQFVSADPDRVVIRIPATKEEKPIEWPMIASVSNGLTREKVVEQWKAQHKDDLCETCHGDRVGDCATCKGSGFDQAQLVACTACGEKGTFPCTNKKCDAGKVDCPKPCLKLSQGQWVERDGKKWREFRGKNRRTLSWSDGHLGELIEYDNGNPVNRGKCPTCEGTTKVNCETCGGDGAADCAECRGTGKKGPPCPQCKDGDVPCATCKGTGLKQA